MPLIETIVADLNTHAMAGIGAKPDSAQTNLDSVLSGTCRVKQKFVHMKASISATNRLSCVAVPTSPAFNGSYIHFEDDWSTVGTMDINRKLIASGNFSGCTYQIYRSGAGTFKCAHIARPAGGGADALVGLMGSYAGQQGWTLLQTVPTAGLIQNGCSEVFVVSQLLNARIDTVRLELSNMGATVRRTLFSTPV
jgi:hypothetical protein